MLNKIENYQLIQRIKKLRQIKPNKEWVSFIKKKILEEREDAWFPGWLFLPIKKPALVIAPLVLVTMVLGGLFVSLSFVPKFFSSPVITEDYLAEVSESQEVREQEKQIVASLQGLQKSLEQATISLNQLREVKDTRKALQITSVMKIVVQETRETVDQIETQNIESKEVFASLKKVKHNSRQLEQAVENTRTGILIEYLDEGSLNQNQEILLAEAREYYNNGDYSEALIKALQVGQPSQLQVN